MSKILDKALSYTEFERYIELKLKLNTIYFTNNLSTQGIIEQTRSVHRTLIILCSRPKDY